MVIMHEHTVGQGAFGPEYGTAFPGHGLGAPVPGFHGFACGIEAGVRGEAAGSPEHVERRHA
ncbi:hypothetical protein Pth03_22980 [Planotetraspora thailandica]|uniref:Uncharacterized protein n=1 Tax=Planotetraspora thailandica TaxID=487172 RepID=A0A8J3V4K1_9ACTN|nr:hypothetical protein Pth03_22980 [Planotetraspora thailandica]